MQNELSDTYIPYFIDDDYAFTTDDGRVYLVSFSEQPFYGEDDFLYAAQMFQVLLTLEYGKPVSGNDPKIGRSVVAIVRQFLADDISRSLFFTCDTADGRQLARFRKFSTWFAQYSDGSYFKLDDKLTLPATGQEFVVTTLVNKQNPQALSIVQAVFDLTAEIRSQK
jgi:hypothetical protein